MTIPDPRDERPAASVALFWLSVVCGTASTITSVLHGDPLTWWRLIIILSAVYAVWRLWAHYRWRRLVELAKAELKARGEKPK